MTEGLSRNILLHFVVILYTKEYFSAYLSCIETLLHKENYSEFQFYRLFRSASDLDDIKAVLVCSFLLQVLMQYFETVPSFYSYLKKVYLKSIGFSKYKGYLNGQ